MKHTHIAAGIHSEAVMIYIVLEQAAQDKYLQQHTNARVRQWKVEQFHFKINL